MLCQYYAIDLDDGLLDERRDSTRQVPADPDRPMASVWVPWEDHRCRCNLLPAGVRF